MRVTVAMENIKAEASFVLESQGVANAREVMDRVRNRTMRQIEKQELSSHYSEYYQNLADRTLIDRFRDLYRVELDMFGYPHSPFTPMSSRS